MTQREEWTSALHNHEREVARLQQAVRALDALADGKDSPATREELTQREIEYNTAQLIRHEISVALLSSRLAATLAS